MGKSIKETYKVGSIAGVIFDRILKGFTIVAGALCIFLMLGISTEVVTRYFFKKPIQGMLEASEMVMLYIAFLSAAWVLKGEGHVSMDMIRNYLNPRLFSLLNVFLSVVGATIALVLSWYGTRVTINAFREGTPLPGNMEINAGYQLMIIPVGSSMLFIQFLRRAFGFWRKSKFEKTLTDP